MDAARQMVVFMQRSDGQSQFSVPLVMQSRDPAFVELHAGMAQNLTADLSVVRLPSVREWRPGRSHAPIQRRLAVTPASTVELMRLETARSALELTKKGS
ncbi:hypothetical protein [Sphingomonas sp. R1]|uniref:hypothetical protein n=1 Tax=Sphingomonas sp. R1 TaxID=399176 RepID=UPI0022258861|nr:hypothetical protein [Sphingomonas sp. R1]UYY76821.1 hypothetical protein OIM94_15120 [Sphingomonas sp. R1]